jgi:hypothetical protein
MECRFPALLACVLVALTVAPAWAATPLPAPPPTPHAVRGGDFPELVVHLPALDAVGAPMPLDCAQVRARRIDELDPVWKHLVERIHLDCEPLAIDDATGTIATTLTAYLRPGAVQLAGAPVTEVRLMDSELWSDRQYVVGRPFADAADALAAHVSMRCAMAQDDPAALGMGDCDLVRTKRAVFVDSGAVGIWIHPDPYDAARTVYAEAWAE